MASINKPSQPLVPGGGEIDPSTLEALDDIVAVDSFPELPEVGDPNTLYLIKDAGLLVAYSNNNYVTLKQLSMRSATINCRYMYNDTDEYPDIWLDSYQFFDHDRIECEEEIDWAEQKEFQSHILNDVLIDDDPDEILINVNNQFMYGALIPITLHRALFNWESGDGKHYIYDGQSSLLDGLSLNGVIIFGPIFIQSLFHKEEWSNVPDEDIIGPTGVESNFDVVIESGGRRPPVPWDGMSLKTIVNDGLALELIGNMESIKARFHFQDMPRLDLELNQSQAAVSFLPVVPGPVQIIIDNENEEFVYNGIYEVNTIDPAEPDIVLNASLKFDKYTVQCEYDPGITEDEPRPYYSLTWHAASEGEGAFDPSTLPTIEFVADAWGWSGPEPETVWPVELPDGPLKPNVKLSLQLYPDGDPEIQYGIMTGQSIILLDDQFNLMPEAYITLDTLRNTYRLITSHITLESLDTQDGSIVEVTTISDDIAAGTLASWSTGL